MARDILAIPAAGVGIEREFSIASCFNQDNRGYSAAVLGALMVCNHHQAEVNLTAKRDYYISLRMEQITDEELEAEIQEDEEAIRAVLTGMREISISDDESDEESDDLLELRPSTYIRGSHSDRASIEEVETQGGEKIRKSTRGNILSVAATKVGRQNTRGGAPEGLETSRRKGKGRRV